MLDKLTVELTFKKNTNYLSFKKNGLLTFPAWNSSPGSYLRAGSLFKSEGAASAMLNVFPNLIWPKFSYLFI